MQLYPKELIHFHCTESLFLIQKGYVSDWNQQILCTQKIMSFANISVSNELSFVRFDSSFFFKATDMTKEIYFKDKIPTALQ